MSFIKDGNVYRTEYEQLVHLTEKHLEQETINQNVSRNLFELGNASNIGGYNYVRFSFEKNGIFYRIKNNNINTNILSENGDYFEISSKNENDIPAYGYFNNGVIDISEKGHGDFIYNYENIVVRNVTKNISEQVSGIELEEFNGTGLLDYNANDVKNQLFNILNDLQFNRKTQYVSFDLNKDGKFNFVFVGVISDGTNGLSIRTADEDTFNDVVASSQSGDTILISKSFLRGRSRLGGYAPIRGDLISVISQDTLTVVGSVLGQEGKKGETGQQGIQGIQGIQGEKGKDGLPSPVFRIRNILPNQQELPNISSVDVGDAYIVVNTSNAVISYDLYFKALEVDSWKVLPNWGVDIGPKGEQGIPGPRGFQGVQGIQGEPGIKGKPGENGSEFPTRTFMINISNLKVSGYTLYLTWNFSRTQKNDMSKEEFYEYIKQSGQSHINVCGYATSSTDKEYPICYMRTYPKSSTAFADIAFLTNDGKRVPLQIKKVDYDNATYVSKILI